MGNRQEDVNENQGVQVKRSLESASCSCVQDRSRTVPANAPTVKLRDDIQVKSAQPASEGLNKLSVDPPSGPLSSLVHLAAVRLMRQDWDRVTPTDT